MVAPRRDFGPLKGHRATGTLALPSHPDEGGRSRADNAGSPVEFDESTFKPTGTVAVVALFVVVLALLWLSIYLILIARGVTT